MTKTTRILLALFLILALTIPALAINFTDDVEIGESYREAVTAMTERGVLNGFPDGSFQPDGTLTREQGAKIVTYMVLGDVVKTLTCDDTPFDDVAADRWSAPCITWCAGREILLGYGDGRFGPDDTLTGDQFAKMLLCALDLSREDHYVGYGSRWTDAVRADGEAVGLYAGDAGMKTENPITREQAALLAYNAVKAAEAEKPVQPEKPAEPSYPEPTVPEPPTESMQEPESTESEPSRSEPEKPTEPEPELSEPEMPEEPAELSPGGTPGNGGDTGDILLPEVP